LSIVVNMTCRISRFQDGGFFQLDPLVTICRLRILCRIVTNQIRLYKQIALESLFHVISSLYPESSISNWQTWSHKVGSSTPHHNRESKVVHCTIIKLIISISGDVVGSWRITSEWCRNIWTERELESV